MPRLSLDDGVLEVFVARFLSLNKPPAAVFTKQLPADVESNQRLIMVAMALLTNVGYVTKEGIPHDLGLLYHRALAIDFISAVKVERPDIIDFFLQEIQPIQSTTQTQFHHYIPRFILKTFAENFSLSNSEFTMDTSNPDLLWFKRGNPIKRTPKVRPSYDIDVYQVEGHTTNPTNVSRAYGVEDMYRDVTEADCMKFEKLLAKHECTSATFIRQIWNEEKDLSLTRAQLGDMKKFLVVMMYRSEYRRSQYFNQSFSFRLKISVKKHLEHNNISNAQTVWFENLKWIIEASVEDIVMEYGKAAVARAKSGRPASLLSPYRGPIHAAELEDFGYLMTHTVACIWQAETGSEFILSDAGFGAFEGGPGIWFHNFFVVSPRFAIVLVNRMYLAERDKEKPCWTSMFGDKLHVFPETIYKKGHSSKGVNLATHATPDDVFKYKRIVVPKEDVYKVNGIILDDRHQFFTYKSKVSMYKSLRYYDKVKKELFHDCRDYSILRHWWRQSIAHAVLHKFVGYLEAQASELIWKPRCTATVEWELKQGITAKAKKTKYTGPRGDWSQGYGYITQDGYCPCGASLAAHEDGRCPVPRGRAIVALSRMSFGLKDSDYAYGYLEQFTR
ncbi:MAG: hypothetical protein J3R72DRAFT_490350 [Linnemannia gamsii]|nr:MAG: hypothetical protein J3R72DRAFT_490350 [Linnemannia gamsii]